MDTLLKIPFELQITLVAGYLAYKIITLGKGRVHRTEDFLLQVLTFGLLARALSALLLLVFPYPNIFGGSAEIALVASITVTISISLGSIWRSFGERLTQKLMGRLSIYRDDHEASVWQSVMSSRYRWTVLQVHLDTGKVLEANFGRMTPTPKTPVLMNDDGVGLYVTGMYGVDGIFNETGIDGNDGDIIFTYVPRSSIKQIDIAWRVPPSDIN